MAKEFRELKEVVQKSALARDAFGANVHSFAAEYDISLPMSTMDAFREFDGRLEQEKKFRKEFTTTLHYVIDPRTNLSKNITAVLRKHLTRDLASKFTAVKASGTKSIFKETCFSNCLIEVLLMKCKVTAHDGTASITHRMYHRELGAVLSNSIDWDGNRKQRKQHKVSDKIPQEKSRAEAEADAEAGAE